MQIENFTVNEVKNKTYLSESERILEDRLDHQKISAGEKNDFNESKSFLKNENEKIEKFVELIFLEETWIQIFNQNNILVDSGLFGSGETILLEFDEKNEDYLIDTGNLGGFEISYDEKIFSPLGRSGEVKKKISILAKLEELKE
jgi:hypothetical protein